VWRRPEGVTVAVERGAFLGVQFHPEKERVGRFGLSRASLLAHFDPNLDVAHGRVVKGVNFVGSARRG